MVSDPELLLDPFLGRNKSMDVMIKTNVIDNGPIILIRERERKKERGREKERESRFQKSHVFKTNGGLILDLSQINLRLNLNFISV